MNKLRRTVFFLIGVIVLSFVFLHHHLVRRPSRKRIFQQTRVGKWNKVKLGKRAISSDGSSYYLYTRRGTSRNLMVYFSGGGGCWNGEMASIPLSLRSYFKHGEFGHYFARIPFYILNMHNGIFNRSIDNPFSEWNIVFIPYSSGDFHIGNTTVDYVKEDGSPARRVRHNGRNNVEEALQWVYQNFDTPNKLLISGSSAGGFGSAFWASEIAHHYADAEIYHLSDSSFLASENWPAIVDNQWKADFKHNFSYAMEADMIGAAFLGNGKLLPAHVVQLHTCTVNDKVLTSFENNLNGNGGEINWDSSEAWSRQLKASTKLLSERLPNFYYFLTDHGYDEKTHTTPHTLLPMKAYFEAEEEGKKLSEWLDGIIHKNERVSCGSRFLFTENDSLHTMTEAILTKRGS